MTTTYTYMARSADDPDQTITFTLVGRHLSIESTTPGLLRSAMTDAQDIVPLATALDPASVDVSEVSAGVAGGDLRLSAWGRWRDQRWRLLALMLEHVDNPDAARVFVAELNRRKLRAMQQAFVADWLQLRGRWFLAGVTIVLLPMIAIRFKHAHTWFE